MDAYSSSSDDLNYSGGSAPVLIAASSGRAMREAESIMDASGLRVGARLPVEEALARIRSQPTTAAVWLELDRDCGEPMDALLKQVDHDVSRGFYAAIVSTSSEVLDAVSAKIGDSAVELIVDANEVERTTALSLALAQRGRTSRYSDIGSDRNAERLRQLSEEVSRIASTLARLSVGPDTTRPLVQPMPAGDMPAVSIETVRQVIRARRLRSRFFSEELFADPAWDMLLDLLQAEIAQLRVPVSSLCIAASVPATTALRWLKTLVDQGLFVRRPDPHDGRRVYVELAPDASHAMKRYFAEVGPVAAI
jgi:DNA-binding MarR family transcriptional regulator